MALQNSKEITSARKVICVDMTRGLDLCVQKKAMTRIDLGQ